MRAAFRTFTFVFFGKKGFTLFELLAVLALISLGVALVTVSAGSGFSRSREKIAARTVASAMKLARERAISERRVYYVSNQDGLLLKNAAGYEKRLEIPEGTRVSPILIVFYPTGRASGGEAVIESIDGEGKAGRTLYTVKVDPSSGWVSLKESENAGE